MVDVPVWPGCDEACVFCSNPEGAFRRPTEEHSLPVLVRRLAMFKAGRERFHKFNDARDSVTLTGGEPTLHPRFFALLSAVRRQFPGRLVRLLTHGRGLEDPAFAARLCAAAGSPFETCVNVAGPRRGLEKGLAGTANLLRLRRRGQRVVVRLVLTRSLLDSLRTAADLLAERLPGLDGLAVIFPEFEGRAARSEEVTGLRMEACSRALEDALPALRRVARLDLYHLPLCVLGPALREHARSTLDPAKVVNALVCRTCPDLGACVGIHKSYARSAGTAEFSPRAGRTA
ncbi:MAG: radical SAM protein [Elusimicrobia bacterium]|nr:radical SAM protein [Elusimicrobiota bacterium]